MTKQSKFERARRTAQGERMRQVEAAWVASIPAGTAAAFAREVEEVRARGPRPAPANMAPGTMPNPPRPGREPKPPKAEPRSRRSSY